MTPGARCIRRARHSPGPEPPPLAEQDGQDRGSRRFFMARCSGSNGESRDKKKHPCGCFGVRRGGSRLMTTNLRARRARTRDAPRGRSVGRESMRACSRPWWPPVSRITASWRCSGGIQGSSRKSGVSGYIGSLHRTVRPEPSVTPMTEVACWESRANDRLASPRRPLEHTKPPHRPAPVPVPLAAMSGVEGVRADKARRGPARTAGRLRRGRRPSRRPPPGRPGPPRRKP